jgi:hypothetical protein
MEICITFGGKKHCFFLPIYEYPIIVFKPRPPGNYDWLIHDASLVATLQHAATKVNDSKVQEALNSGIAAAVKAMQARAGEGVEIHATRQG